MYTATVGHSYPLRNLGPITSSANIPGYQPPSAYIPPHTTPHTTSPVDRSLFAGQKPNIEAVTATLDALTPMLDSLKLSTDFEIGICNVMRIVIGQVKELKLEQHMHRQHTERSFH